MRYGFILANIDKGSSVNLELSLFSQFSKKNNDILFVFPGGTLAKSAGQKMSRNSVYDFATSENIDAAIVWMSTLTGELDASEVAKKFESLNSIPHVNINGVSSKDSLFPNISFDAYGGVKKLINHAIRVHGAKKIAFIRGPEHHCSANERFQAYLDGLKENGIEVNEKLISSPKDWPEGKLAIEELVVTRKLIPGVDFDTLFTASDLMLCNAIKTLSQLGYDEEIENLRFYGFNDSQDIKQLSVPCTTVRLPYEKLASAAQNALFSIINGIKTEKEIILESEPVFRKSCGCTNLNTNRVFNNKSEFLDFVSQFCSVDVSAFDEKFEQACSLRTEGSIRRLTGFLCANSRDLYSVNEVVETIPYLGFINKDVSDYLYSSIRSILPEEIERFSVKKEVANTDLNISISSFKNKLLEANTLRDINSVLLESSNSLGFSDIYLVINRGEKNKLIQNDELQNIEFPQSLVLPAKIMESLDSSIYIVEPLFTENEVYGHLVIKTEDFSGDILEEVRTSVSSAIKSSLLFEQVSLAKQVSEKVEHDRILFFSNMKDKLRNPVSKIFELIDDSESLSEETKKGISSNLKNLNRIIEMSLSRTDELETDFQVLDLNDFLCEFHGFQQEELLPCLFIDPGRLGEAISSICTEKSIITAKMDAFGVKITIYKKDERQQDSDVSYVNEMVIIHGGVFEEEADFFNILLPYPTLSNKKPSQSAEEGIVACFGDKWTELDNIQQVSIPLFLQNGKLPVGTRAIMWDSHLEGELARRCMHILESDDSLSKIPIIANGLPWAESLSESFQKSIGTQEYEILVIGSFNGITYPWMVNAKIIQADFHNALELINKNDVSLIVIENQPEIHMLIEKLRSSKAACTPIIVCDNCIDQNLVSGVKDFPNVMLLNTNLLSCDDISTRIRAVIGGSAILPVYSGTTVKKAQVYLCSHYMDAISRWQVAEAVHVNEDYLTSIFKKETGISLWDYLNRYRVEIAVSLLQTTGCSMYEVAKQTGFQGQAYFCTVFKKIKGFSPSLVRKK